MGLSRGPEPASPTATPAPTGSPTEERIVQGPTGMFYTPPSPLRGMTPDQGPTLASRTCLFLIIGREHRRGSVRIGWLRSRVVCTLCPRGPLTSPASSYYSETLSCPRTVSHPHATIPVAEKGTHWRHTMPNLCVTKPQAKYTPIAEIHNVQRVKIRVFTDVRGVRL